MTSGQEEATQRVVKRLKEDRTLVFRKKGNEKQFIFNDNVKDQLDAAGKHLDLVVPTISGQQEALDRAKQELQKGLELLAGRQKRIKMADRSEYGWAVVDKYEDDELEDDAKKIEKAEKSVAFKAAKRRKTVQSRNAAPSRYSRQPRAPEPLSSRDTVKDDCSPTADAWCSTTEGPRAMLAVWGDGPPESDMPEVEQGVSFQ